MRNACIFQFSDTGKSLHTMSATGQHSAAGREAAPLSELALDGVRLPFPGGFRQILLINGAATLFCASVICGLLWHQTGAGWIPGWWLLHLSVASLILIDWHSRRPFAPLPEAGRAAAARHRLIV